ncbi:transcription factor IIIA-like [Xiphophorus hellerii]|uniref:transcription factor IIIA-like n=1 Tax=Xiphophorus hellerii TaxID=8084 RepID=UPI0013B37B71|nr:transcription factor IIIA-like [Xiphophorus hellerii]
METKAEPHRRFFCSFPDCSAAYNRQWKLDAHLCKHTGLRPHSCQHEGCRKSFCTPYHLARHELVHSGERPFRCSVEGCAEAFTTSTNRSRHVSRAHAREQKKYACAFQGCGQEFKKNKQLRAHMCEQHTQLPPYQCAHDGCQMRFSTPSKLKRHEKVHRGYPCAEEGCPFTGKTWTDLLKHRKEQHRVVLTCEHCSKVFRDSWFLQQHQRVHADTRVVYKCPREGCDRSYTTMFNLQSHVGSFHENLRPFVCTHDGCGRAFTMKRSLQRHSVVHDPEGRKPKKSRPKRSIASRLSGYREAKRVVCEKLPDPKRGLCQDKTEQPGSVVLVSLLQDTSLLCEPTVDTHGLTDVMNPPLST